MENIEVDAMRAQDTTVSGHTLQVKLVSSMEKVLPLLEPSADGFCGSLTALKGETVSFQAAYYGDVQRKQQGTVRIEAPAGIEISVRTVGLVPCAYPCHREKDAGYLVTEPGMYPDLLEDITEFGFPIVSGQWRSLWISVETGENTPAGVYPIRISLRSEADTAGMRSLAAEIEVTVEVLEAKLPVLTIPHTEWFHCDCLAGYYQVEVFSEAHWSMIENFVRHAVKRGCNMLLTPVFTPPLDTARNGERPTVQLVDVTVTEEGYEFGYDRFERWVEMCRRCGIRYYEISHLFSQWGATAAPKIIGRVNGEERKIFGWETEASSEAYGTFLRMFLTSFTDKIKRLGIAGQCYFHISDEPTEEYLESYAYAKNLVKEYLSGYHVIDALSDYKFYEQGLVEEPVCANDHMEPFLEKRPLKLWTYYCTGQHLEVSNRFIALPGYRTRILGIQLYKYAIDGFLHWGYNFYNSEFSKYPIDPYRCTDAGGAFPSGDPFLVYPGREGRPVDSIRSMLMEEAMADLRAMHYLEELADRETVISCLAEEENGEITFRSYPQNADYLIRVRERVNAAIRSLTT